MGRRWLRWFTAGAFLHSSAWGMYFALTRVYVVTDLGGGYMALLLLAGAEFGLPLTSVLWGRLADRYGRRKFVLAAWTGFIPLAMLGLVNDAYTFVAVAALPSLAWSLGWPSVVSPVITGTSIGRRYGTFMVGASLGWGLGSSAMGPLYGLGGARAVFTACSVLYFISYAVFYALYPATRTPASTVIKPEASRQLYRSLAPLLVAVAMLSLGLEWGFNVFAVRLEESLRQLVYRAGWSDEDVRLLYGVFYGGVTTLLGVPARLLAGRVADRYGGLRLLAWTAGCYVLLYLAMNHLHGIWMVMLWQVPLYPFYDTAVYSAASGYAPRDLKASAAGAVMAAQSVGGMLVALAGPLTDAYGPRASIDLATSLIAASLAVTLLTIRRWRGPSAEGFPDALQP